MKITLCTHKGVYHLVIKNIMNEGQLEYLYYVCDEANCTYELRNNCTEMVISGDTKKFENILRGKM
jgi:hypothetical protein